MLDLKEKSISRDVNSHPYYSGVDFICVNKMKDRKKCLKLHQISVNYKTKLHSAEQIISVLSPQGDSDIVMADKMTL